MLMPIILILICSLLTGVKCDCGGFERCEWITWNAWNDCSATCGGGYTIRTRPLCCDVNLEFATCRTTCGLDDSPSYENQDCGTTCFNGGVFGTSSCSCSDGYYGVCCQNGEYYRLKEIVDY